MALAGQHLAERDGGELPVRRREPDRGDALDELLRAPAVLDQILDRHELDPVTLAVRNEVGHAGHRPVLVHDLADDAGRVEAGETGEVDRRLGLPGALEHSSRPRPQREHVAGLDEVVRALGRIDGHLDRARPVGRRDAGGDAFASLDRDRERRLEGRLVVVGHRLQAELGAPLRAEAEADEAPAVRGHEVDRLRRGELRGDGEVALVLPVGRVDDHHELPLADVLDRLLDGGERGLRVDLRAHRSQIVTAPRGSQDSFRDEASSPGCRGRLRDNDAGSARIEEIRARPRTQDRAVQGGPAAQCFIPKGS